MNLGIITPIPSDGTSLYRALGPFSYLSRETGLHIIEADEWGWTNLMQLDCMFMHRPFAPAHAMVAKTCRALNIPLWVDHDDLYPSFPPWVSLQQDFFKRDVAIQGMQFCLDCANVVTVSTEYLRKISPKAEVIPNSLNDYIWPMHSAPRERIITWRGSGGHGGDLDSVMADIEYVAKTRPEWKWHFLGVPWYRCYDVGEVHPWRDAFTYMETMRRLAPEIHVVPLCEHEFNHAKSNNAWLEATSAGAVVLAPDWEEWKRPGITNYRQGHFREALTHLVEVGNRDELLRLSRQYILDNLVLSKVNRQRIMILKEFRPRS